MTDSDVFELKQDWACNGTYNGVMEILERPLAGGAQPVGGANSAADGVL
jgi:hypothetical protein